MANDTIGSLVAAVSVTSGQFTAGMKEIESSLDSTHAHAASLDWGEALKLDVAFEAIHEGIAKAEEAFETFFSTIEAGGKLEVFSQQIGTTAEALSGLQYAASLVDVSSDQLDGAIERMQRTIGELQHGSKEAVEAFQRIGVSLAELQGHSADEQFKIIADHLSELHTASERTAAAMQIFGRSGAELLPILDQGSAAIDKMIESGKAQGAVLTNEQAEGFHSVSRELTALGKQWDGFIAQLATDALPTIRAVAHAIEEFLPWLEKEIAGISETQVKFVAYAAAAGAAFVAVQKLVPMIVSLANALKEAATAEAIGEAFGGPAGWAALLAGAAGAITAVSAVADAFDRIDDAAEKAKNTATESLNQVGTTAEEKAKEIKRQALEAEEALEKLLSKESINPKGAQHARERFNDAAEQVKQADDLAAALQKQQDEMVKFGQRVHDSMRTPLEKFKDTVIELREALDANAISGETFGRAMRKADDELQKATKPHKDTLDSMVNIAGADVSTSAGASLDIAAGRFSKDLESQRAEIAQEHLEEAKHQSDLQQSILDAIAQSPEGSQPAIATF